MKITRLIAFVLVAAMLLPWVVLPESHAHVHAHETEPTITVGSLEGKPGDTLQIPVTISNNPGITILNTRVQFDDEAVDVVNSSNNPEGPLGSLTFMGSQKDGTNPVTMYWESGLNDYTDDGIIGYIEVTIKADAKPGKYDVAIVADKFEAYNISFHGISFDLVAGTIKVLCAEHDFAEYVSDGNATCTADGTKTRECQACGDKETVTDVGSALGHSFTEYVSDNNATCESDGTETAKCDRCDATDTRTAEGTALGHSFTEYVSDNNATCKSDGTETATCDRCDATDTRTDVGSKADAAHSFPAEYTSDGNATCTADGTKSRVCSVCGEKETVTDAGSALGHSYTNYVSDGNATCEADGTETAKCDRCDATDTRTEAGSALGHQYTAKTTDYQAAKADCCHKATYYYTCVNCGEKGTETFEHGEVDLTNHVGGTEVRNAKPATEETEGYTGDTYCLGCETVIAKGESIPVLGHTHDLKKTDAKAAACEAEGNTAYWTCTKCGKLYADDKGAKEITIEETVIAALGHSFTAYVSDGNATCEADGTETAKCDRCDTTDTRTEAGSKLGHQYTAKTTEYLATAADCCHKATYYYTCAHCGKQGTETFEHGDVDLTKHVGGTEVRGAVSPTEEKEGYTGDTYCLGCENVIAKGESIPVLDHTHILVKTEAKAATCETEGNIAYWTCSKCGKLFADAEGVKEITAEDTVTEALGHSYTIYVSDGNAACVADGTETAKCDRCDATDTRTEEGSKLGHSFTAYVSDGNATCEADGTETAKCDRCDATDTRTAAGTALGHSYTNYVSDGNATCEADGTETAKCDRCDATDTRTEEGSALGHDWKETDVIVAPTCTENGESVFTCATCGKVENQETAALGHDWHETEVITAATCTEGGESVFTCGICATVENQATAPLEHTYTNYVSNSDATCEADGTETAKCDSCDETDTRTEEGSALGHDYKSVVTKPTATEKGYTTHTCTRCGDSYVDSYVDPVPGTPDNEPQTGDNSQMNLWMGLLLASVLGAGAVLVNRKKWLE